MSTNTPSPALRVWAVEQIDTETRNRDAETTVLGVFSTQAKAIAYAEARCKADCGLEDEDLDEGDEPWAARTQIADDGGFRVDDGDDEAIFVYLGSCVAVDEEG